MAIKRSEAPAIRARKEAVEVAGIGEVVVYELGLADKLRFATWDGPRFSQMCEALAVSVRDADGEPLYDAVQWDAWGGRNLQEAIRLFGVVERLSSLSEAQAEKN